MKRDLKKCHTNTKYDLEGRRVENPLPGRVYIKGGKKVMLKNREF